MVRERVIDMFLSFLILFVNLSLCVYSLGNLLFIFFLLISFTFIAWSCNESWGNISLRNKKEQYFELMFLMSLILTLFMMVSFKVELLWVVFTLEFQGFIILGACYIFQSNGVKLKLLEGSINYIFPSFFSFTLMLTYILGVNLLPLMDPQKYVFKVILIISVLIKAGSFPFYSWVPVVYTSVSYPTLLLIAIMSKIIVILLLVEYIPTLHSVIIFSGLFSILISSLMMVNQAKIKKLLAFSSVSNIGWVLLIIISAKSDLILNLSQVDVLGVFFFLYSYNLLVLCCNLRGKNCGQIYNLFIDVNSEKQFYFFFFLLVNCFLGMAGLPPFSGFLGKFCVISSIINNNIILGLSLLLVSSLFAFNYLRPIIGVYNTFSPHSTIVRNSYNLKNIKNSLIWLSSLLLILNIYITFIGLCSLF